MKNTFISERTLITGLAIIFFVTGTAFPSISAEKKPVRITSADVARAIDLKKREEVILTKEGELLKREQEMTEVRTEVDQKLVRLVNLQKQIKDQLEDLQAIKTKEFRNLIKVYSAMSASKIAPLFNKMDDTSVVQILRAMKVDIVAKVMPKLNQDKAVLISKRLGMMDKELN